MMIEHKNSLGTYLGDWLAAMDVKARAEGKPSSGEVLSNVVDEGSGSLML
jgi:hypothetical protein